ncbi:MAG: IS110 family transposase [Paludibacteraceae bacterium]|nr:IS110 family transposase [Paludibacteraceae bacterium]
MRYIGIDVSKATFMVAYPVNEKEYKTREFKNTAKGIHEFIRTLEADDHCVMEATGNYSYLLLYLLNQANITTSMENALKVKNFARTMLSVTKTDKADAQLLSLYGERMRPTPFKLPSDSILLLKQKRTAMRQFQKQLHATNNLKKSLEVLPQKDSTTFKSINKIIETLEKQIRKIEEDLIALTQKEFERQMQKLTSIKGVGASLAAAIIISTGGFTYFDNAKQVSRYLGICPTYQQSGTSINVKGHINRNGDSYLRSQLYVASWSMSQHNRECRNLYLRMKEKGKPGKLIMIAVANKVIRQCFAVVKHDTDYVDGFVSQKP